MTPHDTKETVSLNEARNFTVAMSKAMGEAVELIYRDSKEIEQIENLCRASDDEIQKLQERLHFKGFERKRNQLRHIITVCTHKDCTEYKLIGKSKQLETLYTQVCHKPCSLKGVPVETTNNQQLYHCRAMANGTCRHCKHDYRDHMHMTYTTSLVEKTFLSDDVQQEINKLTNVKDKKQKFIAFLEKNIEEYEEEKEILYKCASPFGAFLKQNAMIAYNDSFICYLDLLIRVEQIEEDGDEDRINQLMKDKRAYEMMKKAIIEETSNPAHSEEKDIQIEKIYEMRNQLCSLKHNGKDLKKALGTVNFSK